MIAEFDALYDDGRRALPFKIVTQTSLEVNFSDANLFIISPEENGTLSFTNLKQGTCQVLIKNETAVMITIAYDLGTNDVYSTGTNLILQPDKAGLLFIISDGINKILYLANSNMSIGL